MGDNKSLNGYRQGHRVAAVILILVMAVAGPRPLLAIF